MKQLIEFKKLSAEEKALLERCKSLIRKADSSATVVLYGSRARGDASSESDYDILVLTDGPVSLAKEDIVRRQLFPVEIETGCVITVNTYNYREWNSPLYRAMPFCQNVEREGIIL